MSTTEANDFAIVFFAGAALCEEDAQQMRSETKLWAKTTNAAGRHLQPHMFGDEQCVLGDKAAMGNAPSAVLFLQARDLADAVEVARQHPALRFGYAVQVRPWSNPAATAK